jgi:hypothetical protein
VKPPVKFLLGNELSAICFSPLLTASVGEFSHRRSTIGRFGSAILILNQKGCEEAEGSQLGVVTEKLGMVRRFNVVSF